MLTDVLLREDELAGLDRGSLDIGGQGPRAPILLLEIRDQALSDVAAGPGNAYTSNEMLPSSGVQTGYPQPRGAPNALLCGDEGGAAMLCGRRRG